MGKFGLKEKFKIIIRRVHSIPTLLKTKNQRWRVNLSELALQTISQLCSCHKHLSKGCILLLTVFINSFANILFNIFVSVLTYEILIFVLFFQNLLAFIVVKRMN